MQKRTPGFTPGLLDCNVHLRFLGAAQGSWRNPEEPGSRAEADEVKSGRQAASYQAVCSKLFFPHTPGGSNFREKKLRAGIVWKFWFLPVS